MDPSVCFLCEQSLTALQQSTRIVDTVLDYWRKGHETSRLFGRKYVCEGCTHHIASAFGYVTGPVHNALIEENEALGQRLMVLEKVADIQGLLKDALAKAVEAVTPTATAGKDSK